jgi:topoisomerase IA-like protein
MVGGVVAGPVGAVVGGVVGAMVGNASAEGKRPFGKTVDNIRAVTEEPARRAYARIAKAMSGKKHPTKKPAAAGTAATKPATKKAPASRAVAKKPSAKKTSKT